MHKQLTLIETENASWQATDADKEAAKRASQLRGRLCRKAGNASLIY